MASGGEKEAPVVAGIALLAALRHELRPLLALGNWRREKLSGRDFYFRDFNGCRVVATTSGLGKVMAAATTQLLIDRFASRVIVNFGSCGGLDPGLAIGDLVLASAVVEYDFISHHKPAPKLVCDAGLLDRLGERFPELRQGCLASADRNADTPAIRRRLNSEYQALVADWEGAAVVRVAARMGCRALVLRGVTDSGADELTAEYERHYLSVLPRVAAKVAEIAGFLAAINDF